MKRIIRKPFTLFKLNSWVFVYPNHCVAEMWGENIVPLYTNINKLACREQLWMKTTAFIKTLWSYFNMTFCINFFLSTLFSCYRETLNKQDYLIQWNRRTKLTTLSSHCFIFYEIQLKACLLFNNLSKTEQKLMVRAFWMPYEHHRWNSVHHRINGISLL